MLHLTDKIIDKLLRSHRQYNEHHQQQQQTHTFTSIYLVAFFCRETFIKIFIIHTNLEYLFLEELNVAQLLCFTLQKLSHHHSSWFSVVLNYRSVFFSFFFSQMELKTKYTFLRHFTCFLLNNDRTVKIHFFVVKYVIYGHI